VVDPRTAATWIGVGLALAAAPHLLLLLPLGTGELARAEELGLISFTVRAAYPEAQELNVYLWFTAIAPAILGALLAARGAGRQRRELPSARRASWPRWAWGAAAAIVALTALDVGYLTSAVPWGRFGFLGEEGVYLGTAAGLRAGQALYADLAFSYGPLMGWPVPLALRAASDDVVGYRLLVWAANVAGLGLCLLCLRLLTRRAAVALVALALLAALAVPVLPNLNATTLRLALGAAAAVVAGVGGARGNHRVVALAGVLAALALGFSFEVGVVALLSGGLASAWPRVAERDVGRGLKAAGAFAAGALGALGLLAVALAARGELGGAVETFGRMVDLPGAGYQALPWPDLLGWFRDASGQHRPFPPSALTYRHPGEAGHLAERLSLAWWASWPWLVFAGGAVVVVAHGGARLLRRTGSTAVTARAAGLAGLALFAVLIGRGAVGRSDLYHLQFYGALPALLLGACLVDRWLEVGVGRGWHRAGAAIAVGVGLLSLASWPPRFYAPGPDRTVLGRLGVASPGLEAVDRPRCRAIRLQPELAAEVRAVMDWAADLPADRSVWFYPSEATYAWLTERPPPTPYPWAYDAATASMRADLVDALRRDPPDCVLVTEGTFSIDHIAGSELLPEIEHFVEEDYVPDPASAALPGARVLRHEALEPGACGVGG
jgi:hypothetical protein